MGKCTDAVTNWMIRCHVIHEEDKELYKYAIHSFFSIALTSYSCRRHWLLRRKCKTWICGYFTIYSSAKI